MGILPEALINYLALLGWGAEDGKRETFTLKELTHEFKIERVTASPAIFDFDKLHWLNRHYLKLARTAKKSWLCLRLISRAQDSSSAKQQMRQQRDGWSKMLALFLPSVDQLDQLPEKAASSSGSIRQRAHADEENAALLATEAAQKVLAAFAERFVNATAR